MKLDAPSFEPDRSTARPLIVVFAILALFPASLHAAEKSKDRVWEDAAALASKPTAAPFTQATAYQVVKLDRAALAGILANAPKEGGPLPQNPVEMTLPMPGGVYARFAVVESPIMAPALAAKFPEIKTYAARGIDNPSHSARFDITPHGFHAQILSPDGAVYIDPHTPGNRDFCVCYQKKDLVRAGKPGQCLVSANLSPMQQFQRGFGAAAAPSGAELRTYRIAVAATGEYTAFHGGTVALGQAAVVTAINRVTGIYEVELSIRLELVANNDLLIYTNSGSDPYSNNNGDDMLSENQTNVDAVIGNANYDVGHVFSTGGGGVAGLGVVGVTGQKAEGVTGLFSPVGDPFYIDFVAHELGHQFAGNHSFNGDSGSCSGGNRNGPTAYEPGSGSTIQAYAGICDNDDLQTHSDPHFHSISFDEMIGYVDGAIPSVGTRVATGNSIPTVDAGNDFTVPARTPFALTASGMDGDPGDVLTYSWEERDLGPQQDVSAGDNGSSPIFRVWTPTTNPTRTFPRLTDLIANTTVIGETLPTTTRAMNFRATVRDNRSGGGGVNSDNMVLNVVDTGAPFQVTSPNTVVSWEALTMQTVTWNVAGTTANGINAANVDIFLSTDGGLTYPVAVLSGTPNDGTQSILVPNMVTTQARIRVQGEGNVFFDISDANFNITTPSAGFTLAVTPASLGVCAPSDAVYTVDVVSVGGFTDPVTLSAAGEPAGTTASFSPNPVVPGNSSTLTIGNTGAAAPGSHTIDVTGNSGAINFMDSATLNLSGGLPAVPSLLSPSSNATGVVLAPMLTWSADPAAFSYAVELDDDPAFGSPEFMTVTASANATVTPDLAFNTPYYWRVTAQNACGIAISDTSWFTTTSIGALTPICSNPSVAIPDDTPAGVSDSIVAVPADTIIDLDVSIEILHSWVGDLIVTLEHIDTGTTVTLIDQPDNGNCSGENLNIIIDDEATLTTANDCTNNIPAYTTGVHYQPVGSLSAFDGESLAGTWTLTVSDNANQDTGTLVEWCLRPTVQAAGGPFPTLTLLDTMVDETAGTVVLTATLSATSPNPISVDYTTSNGSAEAGLDYTATMGTLVIPASTPSGPIMIPVLDDFLFEGAEDFTVTLSNSVNVIVPDNTASVTITSADTVFDEWRAGYGLTGALPASDGDKDGLELTLEFGYNLDPLDAAHPVYDPAAPVGPGGPTGLPKFEFFGSGPSGVLRVTFIRRKVSSGAVIAYPVKFTGDLAGLVDGNTVSVTSIDAAWEEVILDDPVTHGAAGPDFRRYARFFVVLGGP